MMHEVNPGLLVINKPEGITSFGIVRQVKNIINAKKVGHCGTLDPLATGILLVLVGRATRLQSLFMDLSKTYNATFQLGVKTDTGDRSGQIINQSAVPKISQEELNKVLARFVGEIKQVPPMYSALKYGGKKLYELARKGIVVKREPRSVNIYGIECLSFSGDIINIRVKCSRGTYIRTLGEDIGDVLGCGATMNELCREAIGDFNISNAIDGAKLSAFSQKDLESLIINENDLQKFINF